MEFKDLLLKTIYGHVQHLDSPYDFPVEAKKISEELHFSLEETSSYCTQMREAGLIKVSHISAPPFLYITKPGIARAKRLLLNTL